MRKESKTKAAQEIPEKISWKDLLAFDEDRKKLKELVRTENLPSVLLFEGRAGIGKKALLYYLAALHFCENGVEACGSCLPCQKIAMRQHPDVLVIEEGGEALKVASVADIEDFVAYAPQGSSVHAKRIVILIDAENLTISAVNKLLKTFEEPYSSTRIFLSTGRVKQLLPTLLSRCVRWHLKPPSREEIKQMVLGKFPTTSEKILVALIEQYGHTPAKILQHLERHQSYENEASRLLESFKVGDILSTAERFKQQETVSLTDFVADFEYALNKLYKQALSQNDFSKMGNPQSRREFLKKLKVLLYEKKTPVNPQMVLEKLGFFNLKISAGSDERF